MARTGITFDEVAAAADALVGAGKSATIQAVRDALGSGSPNTVHKHLSAWRQARPQAAAAVVELPADLVKALGAEISRAAAQARSEIEGNLVQAQSEAAELATVGESLELERDDLLTQVGHLQTDRDQAQATATERAQEIERLGLVVQREQGAAENARIELAKIQLKIEAGADHVVSLESEIERLRGLLDAAQAGRQTAEQLVAVGVAQLDAERAKSADLVTRLAEAHKSSQEAAQEAASARRDANSSRIAEQAAQARLEAAERELTAGRELVKEAKAEVKDVRKEASELRVALAEALKNQPKADPKGK